MTYIGLVVLYSVSKATKKSYLGKSQFLSSVFVRKSRRYDETNSLLMNGGEKNKRDISVVFESMTFMTNENCLEKN